MPPKAIDKRNPLETKDAVWAAIRKTKGFFAARDIQGETRCSLYAVKDYLSCLQAAGYIGKDEAGFYLVKNTGVDAPRVRRDGTEITQGRGRENMWRTMRIITEFSYRDLVIHAATEEHPIAAAEAKSYCQHLHRAGYLAEVSKGKPGSNTTPGKLARYRLLKSRNSGPKPPMIQRVKQVYDQNLKKVVWSEDSTDHGVKP